MRKIYTLLLCACFFSLAQAQTLVSHRLGLPLYTKLQDPKYANSSALKAVMVKGNPDVIEPLVAKYKGVFKFSAGNISSVAIPYKNLLRFSQERGVIQVEAPAAVGKHFMDSARIYNNIDSVQIGYAPLTQAYKGTGVIMGVIDGGFYFRHQDFRRANGNTRIRYLWDQYVQGSGAPQPYGYGIEWDSTAINAGQCTHVEPASDFGHGTNVAGIAAGNGLSMANASPFLQGRYTGVAPDADLIMVRINDTTSDYFQAVIDAVNYIYTKADQMGRPCVINTSIGTYYGSHDGRDMAAEAIDAMLTAKNGRVLVAAAGNAGGINYHVSYPLSATDSLFTWFNYNSTYHLTYYDMWADTNNFKLGNFAIGCDNTTPTFLGRTRYFNVPTDFHPVQGQTTQISDSLFNGSTKLCDYTIAVTLSENVWHIEFVIYPVVTTNIWRLQTKGQGTFDLWDYNAAIPGTSNPTSPLPGGFTSPNYRHADSLKTIVSSWQCSDKVITVANYSNRNAYLDVDSVYVPQVGIPTGSLLANSSIGPTRDGRIKPDIGATGTVTCATGDSANIAGLLATPGNRVKVAYGGKHSRNGGTSMASPIVAGVAALYLQKHPNASYAEVKYVIQTTARLDTFTTHNIPNINFGWGKVNGFAAMKYNVVYGCMDTGSFNYNPLANFDTGGCVPKVYGCTDTGSINYNPAANTNNGTCVAKVYGVTDSLCSNYNRQANVNSGVCIPLGITEALNSDVSFEVIPNPFSDNATIRITTKSPLVNASVRFYDVLGKQVDTISIPAGSKDVVYKNSKLAAGVYDAAIVSDNKIIAVKKVVAE